MNSLKFLAALAALVIGCSPMGDHRLLLPKGASVAEHEATLRALERWQDATGLELYRPLVVEAEPSLDDTGLTDVVLRVRDEDQGIVLGSAKFGDLWMYRPAIKRHQRYAGGYDQMFEAVVLHELCHILGDVPDTPVDGIKGVDFVEPKNWILCITQADLDLVCPELGCVEQNPEC